MQHSFANKQEMLKSIYTKEFLTEEYKEDIKFLERIKSQVTIDGQLPFNVPIDNIPQIIFNCSEWFFRKCEDASEEKWLVIPKSALIKDGNFNTNIVLPWRIISVNETKVLNQSGRFMTAPYSYQLAFRYETMFMTAQSYSSVNVGGYNINAINNLYPANYHNNIGDSMLSIFAQGDMQSIFGKQLRSKYNRNSRKLAFLTEMPDSDVVLNVTERLSLQDLYYDDRFIKYVVGHVLKNINFVLSVFDFKMPGNISINYENYKELGDELINEVKEELDNDDDSPIMMFS
jgi:hypothetical protein